MNHIFQRAIKRAEQTENNHVKRHKNKWALKRRMRETAIRLCFRVKAGVRKSDLNVI